LDIDLRDHTDIVEDVQSLYEEAGPASPRALDTDFGSLG
jgi:hypothetical protein